MVLGDSWTDLLGLFLVISFLVTCFVYVHPISTLQDDKYQTSERWFKRSAFGQFDQGSSWSIKRKSSCLRKPPETLIASWSIFMF